MLPNITKFLKYLYYCGSKLFSCIRIFIQQLIIYSSNTMIKKLLPAILAVVSVNAFAQDNYTEIYNIFQAKCIGCHGSTSPSGQLNLTGSTPTGVYNALVNANPVNPVALAKGNKRVVPGDPIRSFLYRKLIQHADVDAFTHLETGGTEGGSMPQYPNPALTNYEVELIRQWILEGAHQTGSLVNTDIINTFYTEGGLNMNPVIPAAPAVGEGVQYHFGRIFLAPSTEREVFLKIDPMITTGMEVHKIEVLTPQQTHHFVMYKFYNGVAQTFPDGLRGLDQNSHGSGEAVSGFRNGMNVLDLPDGKAYEVLANTIYDYNLHIVNNNPDSVLACDIYINFYTQPIGTADGYMRTRNFPVFDIAIPFDNQEHTFTAVAKDTDNIETNYWVLWSLYSHTHRYGTDYDIYLRNTDGSQGEQMYEGWYNQDYTFNQGYYGWGVEAPERFFEDPFLTIDPRVGLIQQAKFKNTAGPDTVYFGTTSLDEMMVMGFQYFYGGALPAAIEENVKKPFKIYPNPGKGDFNISFDNTIGNNKIYIQAVNALGQTVKEFSFSNSNTQSGNITLDLKGFAKGMYVVRVFSGNEMYNQKLVIE